MLATHFISLPKFGMFQVNGNKIRKLNGIPSHYYILLQLPTLDEYLHIYFYSGCVNESA